MITLNDRWIMTMSEWAWRLAIVALPWQTRWFRDATLGGYPWEQGRVSMYISWALIAFATVLLFLRSSKNERLRFSRKSIFVLGILLITSFIPLVGNAGALGAAIQWWMQVTILAFFVIAMVIARIPARAIATWTVLAIVPHVALAYWQFVTQYIVGSPWLGMASQDPMIRGVSVVMSGSARVLRAYGGFPHPNILGGWISVAICLLAWLWSQINQRRDRVACLVGLGFFSGALVLSFSRAAWIACAVSMLAWVIATWRSRRFFSSSSFLSQKPWRMLIPLSAIVCSMLVVGFWQRSAIFTRFDPSVRLEAKSIDERAESLKQGLRLLREHVAFGTGPNAERVFIVEQQYASLRQYVLEPPHNVFLLVVVHFGLIGSTCLAALVFFTWQYFRRRRIDQTLVYPLIATFFILATFDHYLWSLWAGETLLALGILLTISSMHESASRTDPCV